MSSDERKEEEHAFIEKYKGKLLAYSKEQFEKQGRGCVFILPVKDNKEAREIGYQPFSREDSLRAKLGPVAQQIESEEFIRNLVNIEYDPEYQLIVVTKMNHYQIKNWFQVCVCDVLEDEGESIKGEKEEISYFTTQDEEVRDFVAKLKEVPGCLTCGRSDIETLRCRKCKFAHYCSKECQKVDWQRSHKHECRLLAFTQKLTQSIIVSNLSH